MRGAGAKRRLATRCLNQTPVRSCLFAAQVFQREPGNRDTIIGRVCSQLRLARDTSEHGQGPDANATGRGLLSFRSLARLRGAVSPALNKAGEPFSGLYLLHAYALASGA